MRWNSGVVHIGDPDRKLDIEVSVGLVREAWFKVSDTLMAGRRPAAWRRQRGGRRRFRRGRRRRRHRRGMSPGPEAATAPMLPGKCRLAAGRRPAPRRPGQIRWRRARRPPGGTDAGCEGAGASSALRLASSSRAARSRFRRIPSAAASTLGLWPPLSGDERARSAASRRTVTNVAVILGDRCAVACRLAGGTLALRARSHGRDFPTVGVEIEPSRSLRPARRAQTRRAGRQTRLLPNPRKYALDPYHLLKSRSSRAVQRRPRRKLPRLLSQPPRSLTDPPQTRYRNARKAARNAAEMDDRKGKRCQTSPPPPDRKQCKPPSGHRRAQPEAAAGIRRKVQSEALDRPTPSTSPRPSPEVMAKAAGPARPADARPRPSSCSGYMELWQATARRMRGETPEPVVGRPRATSASTIRTGSENRSSTSSSSPTC